ncbi:hypothetical protein Herbaro_16460 [Herbaspirillum sp. WKF16]|jgi:hypothetical protein|uniref:hypothetical protein n=1 Tax=Herbaspirillum sp. WKF16 TaxID=3028312 RepID=UPI0023A97C0F|nr:hypothetical protein [Herbaspirillum sp. WKF16]WDZ95068.1 hypothetical protein Herbaro_16460 [Herbaspirillum sp. WKF16]
MNTLDKKAAKRALKNVSVQQLETAIAAALYKITAEKYHVDIRRFDLGIDADMPQRDGAVIEMSIVGTPGVCPGGEPLRLQPECAVEPQQG